MITTGTRYCDECGLVHDGSCSGSIESLESIPKTYANGWRECREAAAAELERYASSPGNPGIERDFARSFAAVIRKLEPDDG